MKPKIAEKSRLSQKNLFDQNFFERLRRALQWPGSKGKVNETNLMITSRSLSVKE